MHSISAFDQVATDSASVLFDIRFSQGVSLSLEAGQVYNSDSSSTDFATAGPGIDF